MSKDHPQIAIIEDNADLREELMFFLQHKGFSVWGAGSAEAFWKMLHRNPTDIVLIDLGLPGEDGFGVVDYLSELAGFGLIIITARGQREDKIRGLNLGADLYLVKPVNFSELALSIEALWQRMRQEQSPPEIVRRQNDTNGNWQFITCENRLVSPDGVALGLTPQEYELLHILGCSSGEIFSKEALRDLMFQYEEDPDTHRIDVILSRLRKKAKATGLNLPIRSIFGKGIVFVSAIDERAKR